MIREKRLFCKLKKIKKTTEEIYRDNKREAKRSALVCPSCGSRGEWRGHGGYERSVIDYGEGEVKYGKIRVERVRCESCGHTHAILPDYIVPYSTYSLLFILEVLGAYYLRMWTVEELCRRYSITPSMLYQWKAIYQAHKALWLGVLETVETTASGFIRWIREVEDYSGEFGGRFYEKAACSFLQRHRDAQLHRHAVFKKSRSAAAT